MTDKKSNGANLGFENKLWEMADKMRGHMDSPLLISLLVVTIVVNIKLWWYFLHIK